MAWQSWIIQHRKQIIRGFQAIYGVMVVVWLWGSWEIWWGKEGMSLLRQGFGGQVGDWGIWAGDAAIVTYMMTLVPGMAGRYGVRHGVLQVLMMFRRYLGITTFLLVLVHLGWVWGVYALGQFLGGKEMFWPWFLLAGLSAASLLFLMFLTSNDWSVRSLGPWWKRVHQVTYVIVWLIFLHTSLQVWNIWSVLIGMAAVLEWGSLGWVWWKRRLKNLEFKI